MRTDVAGWLVVGAVAVSTGGAVAQPERYELGQRLKRFEQAWEEQRDPAARKRALAIVKKASGQFLSLQLGEAGRSLDEARLALTPDVKSGPSERWMEALCVVPEKRLVDAADRKLSLTVRPAYPVKGDSPGYQLKLSVAGCDQLSVPLHKLPATVTLPLPANGKSTDLPVTVYAHDKSALYVRSVLVSVVADLTGRAGRWRAAATPPDRIESATLLDRAALLADLASGSHPETDIPAAAVADDADEMIRQTVAGKPYFTVDRPGDFRLAVPTGKNAITSCRLLVPKGLAKDKPVPLVVALHGAGGSENLFFEGYGNGHIVKECQKRGWMLLAPRSGLIGAAPVAAIIDKLAERYPIDPNRIFLVGHSMGAGQAIELVQQHPGKFAAVASLGGAGRVRKKEVFTDLPVFVGVGDQDFALKGSRALHKALTDTGAKRATYKEYPDLEHLVIVREALPDVFAQWDEIRKK
jgi:predicted esterase